MKTQGVIAIVLVGFASLGTGYWLGHRLQIDRKAAETWLAQTQLPDDRKQWLLKTQ